MNGGVMNSDKSIGIYWHKNNHSTSLRVHVYHQVYITTCTCIPLGVHHQASIQQVYSMVGRKGDNCSKQFQPTQQDLSLRSYEVKVTREKTIENRKCVGETTCRHLPKAVVTAADDQTAVTIKRHGCHRVRMRRQRLQTLARLHVPNAYRLVKL